MIMAPVNTEFYSSFQSACLFISPSCSTALARAYSAVLSRSDQREHSCLVSIFSGKGFSFSSLSKLAVGTL